MKIAPSTDAKDPKGKVLATIAGIMLLAISTLVIYYQVYSHSFVWDTNHIFSNEALRSFSVDHVIWMLSHPMIGNWHPLTWLSHMTDYSLFGNQSGYHHLVNVAVHFVNGVLVFFLVRQLCLLKVAGNASLIALTCALIFIVHPLRVESVAWVAARKDLLYAMFFLVSISYYIRYRSGDRMAYAVSLGMFLLSLLSKSMAVTLPAVLLVLDLYLSREKTFWSKVADTLTHRIADKLPYAFFALLVSCITLFTQSEAMGEDKFTLVQQLKISVHNVLFYIEKFFVPFDLSPFYPFPPISAVDAVAYWLPGLLFISVTSLVTLILAIRSILYPLICWLIYLVTLLPASGIIHVGSAVSADRYTYLPHLAITVGLVVAAYSLVQRLPAIKSVATGLTGFWILVLIALSHQQTRFWASPVTLWTRVLQVHPETAIAHRNISTAYYLMGEYSLALEHLELLANKGWPVDRELTAAYLATGNCRSAADSFARITPKDTADAADLTEVHTLIERCFESR